MLQTFILNEGLLEQELGVLGMENPLESCSIGEDDIIVDAVPKNKQQHTYVNMK